MSGAVEEDQRARYTSKENNTAVGTCSRQARVAECLHIGELTDGWCRCSTCQLGAMRNDACYLQGYREERGRGGGKEEEERQ